MIYGKDKSLPLEKQIDLICILNNGLIYHGPKERPSSISIYPDEGSEIIINPHTAPADNLRNFYLSLNHIITQAWTRPIRLTDYFKLKSP